MMSSSDLRHSGKGQVITGSHNFPVNHQVSVSDFSLIRLLGSGAFGKVYLARKTGLGADHGRVYALKSLKKATILSKVKGAEHTIAERKILEAVRQCPFLVTLHYAFQTDAKLFLVLDYLGGGELFTHLVQRGKFSVDETTFYAAELLVALSALHDLGIIYRDLKLENILLDNEGHVVLTDFGLSRKFNHWEHDQRTYSYCGTVEYMAPEVVDKGHGYDFTADWWSLGVLAYELLTGTSPFTLAGHDNSQQAVRKRVLDGKYPPLSQHFPMATRAFVESLLVKDPHKRLGYHGADEIRGHAFFFKINWADVVNKKVLPPFRPKLDSELDVSNFSSEFTSQVPSDMLLGTSPGGPHISPKIFRDYSYIAPFHIDETGAEIAPVLMNDIQSVKSFGPSELDQQIDQYIGGPTERLKLLQKFKACDFFQKYKVDFEQPPIGRGSFSTVRKCINYDTGEEFAVKILNRCVRVDSEIQTMQACQGHPGIVRLVEVMHDRYNSYVVTELLRGGELLSQIQKKQNFRESDARRVFKMVVDAVRFMHERNVAHLDLKPENILFVDATPQSEVKVVDFGFARFIRDLNESFADCYTLQYASPEVLISHCYSPMCDLWSLGVILYVMLSGHVPFVADSPESMAELVKNCHFELERDEWRNVSLPAKDLIRHLLTVDPSERMTMPELMEHAWLTMEGLDNSLQANVILRDNRGETGGRIHRALAAFFKATRDIRVKEAGGPQAKKQKKLGSKSSKNDLFVEDDANSVVPTDKTDHHHHHHHHGSGLFGLRHHSKRDSEPGIKLNEHVIHKVASEAVFHLKAHHGPTHRPVDPQPTHVSVHTPNFTLGEEDGEAHDLRFDDHSPNGSKSHPPHGFFVAGGKLGLAHVIPEEPSTLVLPSRDSSRNNLTEAQQQQMLAKNALSSPNLSQLVSHLSISSPSPSTSPTSPALTVPASNNLSVITPNKGFVGKSGSAAEASPGNSSPSSPGVIVKAPSSPTKS